MNAGAGVPEAPRAGPHVSELMAECLARLSAGEEPGLDELCASHPSQAEELRDRMARLEALGMPGGPSASDPETVGPFRVVGALGQGGMGRVYLAQQASPVRRLVALKVMAVLSHPGICQVYEAGATQDARPWFAMEYVDGLPIAAYCERIVDTKPLMCRVRPREHLAWASSGRDLTRHGGHRPSTPD
jgi:hypothetical protein